MLKKIPKPKSVLSACPAELLEPAPQNCGGLSHPPRWIFIAQRRRDLPAAEGAKKSNRSFVTRFLPLASKASCYLILTA